MNKNHIFANIYFLILTKMKIDDIIIKIKELRKEKGFTQQEMADLLKITKAQYSNYERGSSQMTLKTFLEVLNIFEVDTEIFFKEQIISTLTKNDIDLVMNTLDNIRGKLT